MGGLLLVRYATDTYYTIVDGNGNVTGLVDPSDGSSAGVYEYDPFGNLLRATGPMANANPFRFSTKYQDGETDLVYYGYRWYDPVLGRGGNRDPIGRFGGLNEYAFIFNNPSHDMDPLGLKWLTPITRVDYTSMLRRGFQGGTADFPLWEIRPPVFQCGQRSISVGLFETSYSCCGVKDETGIANVHLQLHQVGHVISVLHGANEVDLYD